MAAGRRNWKAQSADAIGTEGSRTNDSNEDEIGWEFLVAGRFPYDVGDTGERQGTGRL